MFLPVCGHDAPLCRLTSHSMCRTIHVPLQRQQRPQPRLLLPRTALHVQRPRNYSCKAQPTDSQGTAPVLAKADLAKTDLEIGPSTDLRIIWGRLLKVGALPEHDQYTDCGIII